MTRKVSRNIGARCGACLRNWLRPPDVLQQRRILHPQSDRRGSLPNRASRHGEGMSHGDRPLRVHPRATTLPGDELKHRIDIEFHRLNHSH